jgi:hypothetical protein
MLYNYKGDIFKIVNESGNFKLYHKAQNKWSAGWTYIGKFKSEEAAKTAARQYSF